MAGSCEARSTHKYSICRVLDQYTDIGAQRIEGGNVTEFERYVLIKERVEKIVSRVKRGTALKDKTKTEHK